MNLASPSHRWTKKCQPRLLALRKRERICRSGEKLKWLPVQMIAASALVVFAAPVSAAIWALDFKTETWDHSAGGGSPSHVGWEDHQLIGSTTVNGIGITVEFGFAGDAVGNAHDLNATYYTHVPTFDGLLWGLKSNSGINTAPTLSNYGMFTITFDRPVTGDLKVADFDSGTPDKDASKWRDGAGFEAFTGKPGAIGTGIAPDTTVLGSEVTSSTEFGIETFFTSVGGGKDLSSANAVTVGWNQPITTIRGYHYNSEDGSSAGQGSENFGVGIISSGGSAVPEPGNLIALSLLVLGGVAVPRNRRFQLFG